MYKYGIMEILMKHKHHILPKHAGGSDDSYNIVELTIEEHAEEHRKLYEQYGKIEDYCAWQGLIGSMNKQDIFLKLMNSEEIKEKISKGTKEYWNNLPEEIKIKRKNQFLEARKLGYKTAAKGKNWKLSEETKKKQSKPKSENHCENIKLNHADFSGVNNPSYGTIWITDDIVSVKINKMDTIPEGWRKGRAFKPRKSKVKK